MLIKIPKPWEIPERLATPEDVYMNRRKFVRQLGLGAAGISAAVAAAGCGVWIEGSLPELEAADLPPPPPPPPPPDPALYPAMVNGAYTVPERPVTDEETVTTYNNFYEFSTRKTEVWQLVGDFQIDPWSVEVTGLVRNPRVYTLEDLLSEFQLEERLYRFRCVETWAMTVPWTGFPLADLIAAADPLSEATHVRMQSAHDTTQMPGVAVIPNYPWPYHEGLRLEEATNEMSMLVTGAYGKPLLRQNGAPVRLITPWKVGYKSIKSIIRIELVTGQPDTFWHTANRNRYDFLSNVDPDNMFFGGNQSREFLIPTGDVVPTQLYNGYQDQVGHLYT